MRGFLLFAFPAVLGAVLLAACAAPKPPAPPPSATVSIDGIYKGSARGSCGASDATVELRDRRFVLSLLDGSTVLEGEAEPNGMLRAARFVGSREFNFTGRVDGTDLRGGSYNGRCAVAFTLTRVGAAPIVTTP